MAKRSLCGQLQTYKKNSLKTSLPQDFYFGIWSLQKHVLATPISVSPAAEALCKKTILKSIMSQCAWD